MRFFLPAVRLFVPCFLVSWLPAAAQQTLTLPEALRKAVENYGSVKAKAAYAEASQAQVTQAQREYLPNLVLGAQQAYGTINGQNGPSTGLGGLTAASSGPALPQQNWNAAFGALYLANVNWDFFAFGRAKERIETAKATAGRDKLDLQQELFQQQVRTAGAYLNLLAAQRITQSYRKNLARADTFGRIVISRALGGLIAGVDSSQANAEISGARIALTNALSAEQERAKQLAVLTGLPGGDFLLDSLFILRVPAAILQRTPAEPLQHHPVLDWYKSRIGLSNTLAKYYDTFRYPAFSLVGIFQTRGSGFGGNYFFNQSDLSNSYFSGVKPTRVNYLLGVGVTWNLTQILRVSQQVKAQRFISQGLEDEYTLARQELDAQLRLSDQKISNALANYREVPTQVKAAADAYVQKRVMYENGLSSLVDVNQARYVLTRAETDRDIAYNNVWQALLLKAAAAGDFTLFLNQL